VELQLFKYSVSAIQIQCFSFLHMMLSFFFVFKLLGLVSDGFDRFCIMDWIWRVGWRWRGLYDSMTDGNTQLLRSLV
jgi:hypothetical protein